ncbi:MAG: DUF4332 domain-containing protein [Planctomycetota bacterium]|jgi:hypothetical protein
MSSGRREDPLLDLKRIPGVGDSIGQDLVDIGIRSVADLKGRDPEELFGQLCRLHGTKVDRCVLYVFREAVYFASHRKHDPRLLKWWNWKDEK